MDFESAEEYLKSFISYEEIADFDYDEGFFNLGRLRDFLDGYGIDYSKLKYLHVAGSKGKGSVSTMIAEYLKEAGYRVGLFTSPHLISLTERFWLNGECISRGSFVALVADLKEYIDSLGDCKLTYFELLTVIALKYFVDENVEYAVLEVGLGGRLDSTNIVLPQLSILTTVEKEHSNILGESLAEILDEKLGIVKEGVPALVGYQSDEVDKLIRKKLSKKKDLFFAEEVVGDLSLKNLSQAQADNGKVVFAALRLLFGEVNEKVFYRVFNDFKMLGRFDLREIDGKFVVFDMAHTVSSIGNLVKSLKQNFSGKTFVFLFALMRGKDVENILKMIGKVASKIVFTNVHEKRGIDASELLEFAKKKDLICEIREEKDYISAYNNLFEELKKDQVLVVTGSHFLVGKLLE